MKNKKSLIIFTVSLVALFLTAFSWWYFYARFRDFTRDAYVHGNQVSLTPQISGYVSAIYCEETDYVEEGQVLVTLDETDNRLRLDKAIANLGTTIRYVTELFENVYTLAAVVKEREASFLRAEVDYVDREKVVASGAISTEEFIHAKTSLAAAEGALEASCFNLRKAISAVDKTTVRTHPRVRAAAEEVRQSYINLKRCTIKAPATGLVAQRGVQVGESISPSSQLLAIVPLDQIWVDANFKEIHMKDIRIGQEVTMTSDFYGGGAVYRGRVLGIAGGTGAVFSPLPPQNATGNWIKIVQRVPVRISVSEVMLKKYPLRLGLSMNVTIHVEDTSGEKVPKKMKDKDPIWKTNIFKEQEEGVSSVIEKVFMENISFEGMISEEVRLLGTKR